MRISWRRRTMFASAWCLAWSCALTAAPAGASIHPGDALSVIVYSHPELSTSSIKVDSTGKVTLPLAGAIALNGLDTQGAAAAIRRALARFVQFPAVSVQLVDEAQSVFVSGGPGGVLRYAPGESLTAALEDVEKMLAPAASSNETSRGAAEIDWLSRSRIDLRRVTLLRDGGSLGVYDVVAMQRSGAVGPALHPGDTIVLVDKPVAVTVSGSVVRPGVSYLTNDEPLSDAIAQAGGLLPTAATAGVELSRAGAAPARVALGDPIMTARATDGDVLRIPAAPRVTVVGMVEHPGPAVLQSNFTLLSALYTAGGPTKYADLRGLEVVRNGARANYDVTALTHGDLSQNPTLHDGDLVFVPEGHRVDYLSIFQALLPVLYLIK